MDIGENRIPPQEGNDTYYEFVIRFLYRFMINKIFLI